MLEFRWYTGNDEMPGETSESLRLSEVTRDLHNRRISCEATNRVGSTRQVYTLDVECKDKLTTSDEQIKATVYLKRDCYGVIVIKSNALYFIRQLLKAFVPDTILALLEQFLMRGQLAPMQH